MATPSINHGTLTADDIREAHRRLDVVEQQLHRVEQLARIRQAEQDAQRIIAQAKQSEVR